jgi:2-oxoglutarate dehydrogenase E2 component (dihydrolipoamide succinyltransferase)
METTITLPKLGEGIHHATIVQWLKKEGDFIEKDEALLEVMTDKVNSEIPSTVSGTIKKILAAEGREVEVGEALAIIGSSAEGVSVEEKVHTPKVEDSSEKDFLSPAVLKLLQEHRISFEEAKVIPREIPSGRLSKKDVERYLEKKKQAPQQSTVMNRMRKAIAENMILSSKEIPSASLITKVDVTPLVEWMDQNKERLLKKTGIKISITAFVIKAIAEALGEFPLVNASLEGEEIVFHADKHIGVAVNVEGGLVVPVLHKCQEKKVMELAQELQEKAVRAREGKLSLEEMQQGTITLTNFGMTGIQMGFPIIRYPEVAILGMGAIHKEVAVLPDDTTAICSMLYLSLSFDHRLFDGIYACNFLRKVQLYLEQEPEEVGE